MTSVFAHRGATEHAAENTVEAFLDARRLGADGVELDVRRSGDGALVVHHDPVVPGVGPVSDLVVSALPDSVPLLEAALDACTGMTVNVEIKNDPREPGFDPEDAVADLVAGAVADLGWTERVIVSSFRLETLLAAQNADPRLAVGLLVPSTADPAAALETAAGHHFSALHPFVAAVDARLVAEAHRRGLAVNVWTVNHPDDMVALCDLGVDALITDQPARALGLLRVG